MWGFRPSPGPPPSTTVERRPLKQWMLRITAYAQRLMDDLEPLDWPESVKALQRNWIGRSVGAHVDFEVDGHAGGRWEWDGAAVELASQGGGWWCLGHRSRLPGVDLIRWSSGRGGV